MNFTKNYDVSQFMSEDETEKEKIEILELDTIKIHMLRSLKFKILNFCDNNKDTSTYNKDIVINLNDIVGTSRIICNENNWFDYMLKDAHKMRNFNEFAKNKCSYQDYLLTKSDDLPHVYEYNNEYYIGGNGKHRIVIAKCFEIEKIRVISTKI